MRFSLATKLTLFMGGAMALVVMAIVLTVSFYVQESLQKEYHLRCLSSAGYLARHIRAPLITNNLYSLHEYFLDTVQQELFRSAMLLDRDGKVLMHNDLQEIGKVYSDEQSRQALQADEPVFSKAFLTEDGLLQDEIFLPIVVAGMRLGTLRLSHSHVEIEKTVGDSRKKIILVGIVAILGSLLLANFLAAIITRPIRHLTEATKKVARGDLNLSVDGNKGDELGVLAHSFNAMTRELQKTTVSHDYLHNIFNSSSDAIRTINLEFDIVMNNRSMTDFLNGKAENLQGCKCYQLISADMCNSEECVLQRIAKGEKFVQLETLIEVYDARKKYVRLTATPLMKNDRIVGVIESIQDITEQKVAEKESRNLQTQLVQAQKMESVGRLAGGVAHDFNNILSVIIGYSQLGQLSVPKEHPLGEKLQTIQDAAQKAAALVRQLLAFSRKQVLEMTVLNLNDVVADMMKMLSRVIGEDIKLEMSLDSARKIFGDHSQLVQVLMNLAVNARDAMPNGGKLVIETSDVDLDEDYSRIYSYVQPGPHVMLSISDTGIGMSKEVMKNIFEPFFTTKGPESGTGLGLSTVYGTVKQHGGHIHVYSEPDMGTTFKIYLPATDKENEAIITTDTWQDRRGNETILIVEDEHIIRQLLKDILRPQGYQIFMAANGREALELYKTIKGKLDVLLTDVIMPEMDGRELARRIAEMSPETKIIFMSGYAQSIIMQHDSVQEHPFFIQKPITPSVLSAKLRQALGEQAAIVAS